ncbi:MAG: hypothetical protein ACK4IS_07170 [Erythrobacter sp.]
MSEPEKNGFHCEEIALIAAIIFIIGWAVVRAVMVLLDRLA